MGILLTKEENPYTESEEEPVITDLPSTRTMMHRAFAPASKAQLKKVYEWGEEYCMEHNHLDTLKRQCPECWQSLGVI